MSLLSSATLGQNPLAPTSALDRQDGREDLVVRRGIDRLRRQHGDGEGSGSEGSDEEVKGGRKGKGKAREEIVDVDVLDGLAGDVTTNGGPGPSGKSRRKRTKQVSFSFLLPLEISRLTIRLIGTQISCLRSLIALPPTLTLPTLKTIASPKQVLQHRRPRVQRLPLL